MAFSFSFTQAKPNNKGLTLIELLIVVTIMGILAATVAFSIREMVSRGRVAKAQGDANSIAKAIRQLELDTNQQPSGQSAAGCTGTTEVVLNTGNTVGLLNNNGGTFTNWKGPYIEELPKDPWNQDYIFDPDYTCDPAIKGCEKLTDGTVVKAVHSGGENRSGIDAYASGDTDDILVVLCQR